MPGAADYGFPFLSEIIETVCKLKTHVWKTKKKKKTVVCNQIPRSKKKKKPGHVSLGSIILGTEAVKWDGTHESFCLNTESIAKLWRLKIDSAFEITPLSTAMPGMFLAVPVFEGRK